MVENIEKLNRLCDPIKVCKSYSIIHSKDSFSFLNKQENDDLLHIHFYSIRIACREKIIKSAHSFIADQDIIYRNFPPGTLCFKSC